MIRPINTMLIANRGEIACRVMRTARRMGIRTIAVYSEADRDAQHVLLADEAYPIGSAPARQSYLRADTILDAAKRSGADAIHPGYGFLSENADFAEACAAAGVIFLGPPPSAIRAMGSKSAAKTLMEKAGVPLVPGYHGDDQSLGVLAAAADRIAYPVLIKASAGGGGKGMKVVTEAASFADALDAARREALSSFGDDRVLVEKYLTRPRHIEMQVFADTQGNIVHLFERDCSIQRRHQKVVEEAPAPGMTPERRRMMGEAAIEAARAVGYVGAGTIEFIAEGEDFFFMEMNTRLQVEHPVTEAITGQDLVEWQIRIGRGEALPLSQDDLTIHGHAIEVRLYAEDPSRDFLPQIGTLAHLALPEGLSGVRVDAGVRSGDSVSIHYDPMIAKIIASGADRTEAVNRLRAALNATEVVGVATNKVFLQAIAAHPAFAAAELDTGFIGRYAADLLPAPEPASDRMLALAVLAVLRDEERRQIKAADPADRFSPWGQAPGWSLNHHNYSDVILLDGGREVSVRALFQGLSLVMDLPAGRAEIEGGYDADGRLAARLNGVRVVARAVRDGKHPTIFAEGKERSFTLRDPREVEVTGGEVGRLVAPMPGLVTQVLVAAGDTVAKGARLLTLEAMKMEIAISAPRDGVVARVDYAVGDLVAEGAELLKLEELP
jgi:3-methylcrotonyl-CoA carboxylase alpha subunit